MVINSEDTYVLVWDSFFSPDLPVLVLEEKMARIYWFHCFVLCDTQLLIIILNSLDAVC